MKTYILTAVLIILLITALSGLGVLLIRRYYKHKAKKMTVLELVEAQIEEGLEDGWFSQLKYDIYCQEYAKRPGYIPPSDGD